MKVSEIIVTFGNLVVVAMAVIVHGDLRDRNGDKFDKVMDVSPMTIRVVTGNTALLPCRVSPTLTEKLHDQYKVMWVSPLRTAISLVDRRIINDQRMSVERPFLQDWNLHIRNVSLTDAGVYKCQINTDTVRSKNVTLIVQDPPSIIDHSSPLEIHAEEKGKVELFCNATGFPEPKIVWYRMNKHTHKVQEKVGDTGNSLVIRNISRNCADSYKCVATNGVEPSISQTFQVSVMYPPEVTLPNSRLGQSVGKDTIIECEVLASPTSLVVWVYRNRTIVNSQNHELNLYNADPDHFFVLSLKINNIQPEDFGTYECRAVNKLGSNKGYMELYELKIKTTTTTTTTTTPRYTWQQHNNNNNNNNNQNMDIHRGRGRGGANGSGRNQGLIWDRQGNNRQSSYSSDEDALRTEIGNEEKNPRGRTEYSGMRSRKGNNGRGSRLRDDEGSASSLMSSVLLMIVSAIFCQATNYYATAR